MAPLCSLATTMDTISKYLTDHISCTFILITAHLLQSKSKYKWVKKKLILLFRGCYAWLFSYRISLCISRGIYPRTKYYTYNSSYTWVTPSGKKLYRKQVEFWKCERNMTEQWWAIMHELMNIQSPHWNITCILTHFVATVEISYYRCILNVFWYISM